MMLWFDRLYPPLMLLFPAMLTLFVRRHPLGHEEQAQGLTRALWLVTIAVLVVHIGTQALYETAGLPGASLHRLWIILFPMAGFMALWFGVAARLLAARSRGWRNTDDEARTTRSASLIPRHLERPAPKFLLAFGWVLYVACIFGGVWAVSISTTAFLLLPGLFFWPGFAWGVRAMHLEAEPRDAAGSPELAAEYAALRRMKASGFLICGMAGSLIFTLTSLLVVLRPEDAGYVGGLGGAAVGIFGGVFGTVASMRRARILSRLAELENADGPAAATG